MSGIRKVFRTFIPYIILIGVIVVLAFVSQIWAEVREEPVEMHYVTSSN
jgi:hypothetical protein